MPHVRGGAGNALPATANSDGALARATSEFRSYGVRLAFLFPFMFMFA
jgi:hypothetical protein